MQQFQVTNGKLVKPHILSLIDARKRGDMVQFIVLRLDQIMDGSTSCDYTLREVIDTEALQRDGMEMLVENLVGIIVGEDPVVEDGEVVFGAKQVDEILAFVALQQHFGRIKALQQFVDVFVGALCQIELSR